MYFLKPGIPAKEIEFLTLSSVVVKALMPLRLESVNHVKVFEDSSEGFAYPVQRVGFERRGLGENRNVNAEGKMTPKP